HQHRQRLPGRPAVLRPDLVRLRRRRVRRDRRPGLQGAADRDRRARARRPRRRRVAQLRRPPRLTSGRLRDNPPPLTLPALPTPRVRYREEAADCRLSRGGRATIPGVTTTARLYSALVRRDVESENELPDCVRRDVSRNGLRLVAANTLQSSGDQTVSASTVLPWLFHVLGVPAALIGLLVPIRETGSMLPQAFLTPLVVRVTYRKWVLVAGAAVQAAAVAVIALVAAFGSGTAAGLGLLAALAGF